MSEVKSVIIITAKPSGPGDLGECEEGFYTVTNGVLTMCDRDGVPLRDDSTGRRHEMKLLKGDNEVFEAKRLALSIFRSERSKDVAGFGRRINYGRNGYA